ncbi:MAG: antitoxin [Chlorobi bacterium]|nr:antitoxin [Chlorobiota bacterium]MCI0716645.1 antitoxin [Chlorobiota bacterium]
MKADGEEKKLLKSIQSGEWTSVKDLKTYKKHLADAARKTMLKDRRMNIRIAKRDLDRLKSKALEEGIPYQTLVSSILHKYLSGKLKETA